MRTFPNLATAHTIGRQARRWRVLTVITQCVTQPNKPAMAVHFLWLANVILGVSFLPFRARFALQPPVVN